MKNKIINNGISLGSNGQGLPQNPGQSSSGLPKELPNIQTRSLVGGMPQGSPQNSPANTGATGGAGPSNYAGLSAYLQNGKGQKPHLNGG